MPGHRHSPRGRSRSPSADVKRKRLRPSSLDRDDPPRDERPTGRSTWNDYGGLVVDEEDSKALSKLQDYDREAELSRRHDKRVRDRQREELLAPKHSSRSRVESQDRGSDLDMSEDERSDHQRISGDERTFRSSQRGRESDESSEHHERNEEKKLERPPENLFRQEEPADGRGVETRRLGKRLEKSLQSLTATLLETIRLSQKRIREMQEHPQVAQYLQACLVRIPNIHKTPSPPSSDILIRNVPPFVAARIISLDHGHDNDLFELTVAPLSGGPNLQISVSDVTDDPFDDVDVAEMQLFLRDRVTAHEFAESLPRFAKEKASQLRGFTFSENDVAEILERKRQQQQRNAPASYQACYQRRADVEAKVEQLKTQLQSATISREDRKSLSSQLKNLEVEMYSLHRQVETFRTTRLLDKETSVRTSTPLASLKPAVGGLFIHGSGGGRGALKSTAQLPLGSFDRSPHNDGTTQSLTARRQETSGPEVTLRILAAIEASSRDKTKQETANPLGMKAKLGVLIADAPVSQQIDMLKGVLETYSQYWNTHDSFPSLHTRTSTKFPPLLRAATSD